MEEQKCEDCGAVLDKNDTVCPVCGCPVKENDSEQNPQKVEVTSIKIPKISKKKKTVIVVSSVLAVLLIIGVILGIYISKKSNSAKYKENLSVATSTMLSGASTAEEAGGLIHDVWYNTIYEKEDRKTDKFTKKYYSFNKDFNDSLLALMIDDEFKAKIESIKSNQELVNNIMKDLVNPPDEYKEAYEKIQDLYDAYLELTNLAINPTGNLSSYTSSYNSADTAVANAYKAMQRYIE